MKKGTSNPFASAENIQAEDQNAQIPSEDVQKGYAHLLHKLIVLILGFGEVLNVLLQALDLLVHGIEVALQSLG